MAATPLTNSVSPTGRSSSGPSRAVEGAALDEHGSGDAVAAVEVGQQLVQQVAPAAAVPQMMVRIDDRQVRFQGRLDPFGKPILADGKVVRRPLGGAAHVTILRDRPMLAAWPHRPKRAPHEAAAMHERTAR